MFDISFTELLVIGAVALVVIGPERLPKVARTVGHLLGRAQRYVSDVKSDIQREMELDELKKFKAQMDEAASSLKTSLREAESSIRQPLDQFHDEMSKLASSATSLSSPEESAPADAAGPGPALPDSHAATSAPGNQAATPAAESRPAAPDTAAAGAGPAPAPGSLADTVPAPAHDHTLTPASADAPANSGTPVPEAAKAAPSSPSGTKS